MQVECPRVKEGGRAEAGAEVKNQLVISNAKMKKRLKEIEDKVLYLPRLGGRHGPAACRRGPPSPTLGFGLVGCVSRRRGRQEAGG